MVKVYLHRNISLGNWRQRATAAQWAIIAGVLVLMVPIMLLALVALLVSIIVFSCVGLILRITTIVRNLLSGFPRNKRDICKPDLSRPDPRQPDADGRVNVRILRH